MKFIGMARAVRTVEAAVLCCGSSEHAEKLPSNARRSHQNGENVNPIGAMASVAGD